SSLEVDELAQSFIFTDSKGFTQAINDVRGDHGLLAVKRCGDISGEAVEVNSFANMERTDQCDGLFDLGLDFALELGQQFVISGLSILVTQGMDFFGLRILAGNPFVDRIEAKT